MKTIIGLFFLALIGVAANATDYVQQVQQQYVVPVQKTIEYDSRYAIGLDGYFSAREAVSQQKMESRLSTVENQLEKLTEILQQINEKLNVLNTGGNSSDSAGNPNNQPDNSNSDNSGNNNSDGDTSSIPGNETPQPQEPEQPTEEGDGAASELDTKVYEIFSTKCSSCHGQTDSKGNLQLVNKEGGELFFQSLPYRAEIYFRTNGSALGDKNRMPPGNPLSDEEVTTLLQWMVELADKEREKE